ncbi:hypothetical protein MPSI1_001373 [Malassezia psittaci]|uniref:Cyclin N-terminal domain-containing protein n=1 Tax=Malassezia psittaci TaxID=1821823 RepID=A0AAF0FA27_9BASI|nr:hypothetical protein MPSI1_001373 [Malassezia psittaci]
MSQATSLNSYPNRHSFYGWPKNGQSSVANAMAPVPSQQAACAASTNGPALTNKPRARHSTVVPLPVSHMYSEKPTFVGRKKLSPRYQRIFNSTALEETEYQTDILEHMRTMEKQTMPSAELMNAQPELHWFMRPYLVDFLIEIHQSFRLRPETLYLTMNMVDRYVSKRIVYKRHYQLVGCAALLIAAKFEDAKDRVPTVQELSQMCCNAYDACAFTQMEGHVLSTLDWTLGHPTAESWLRYEYTHSPPANPSTHSVARFLLEVTLFHQTFLSSYPSSLAAGAMLLARHICRDPRPLTQPAGRVAVMTANQIHAFIAEHINDLSLILIKKYSYGFYAEASTVVLNWFRKHAGSNKSSDIVAIQYRQEHCSSDEDGESMCSNSTDRSVFSTPSRSLTRDDDDDESLPVTPLSLNSTHDHPNHHLMLSGRSNPTFSGGKRRSQVAVDSRQSGSAPWMNMQQLKPIAKHPPRHSMAMELDSLEKAN